LNEVILISDAEPVDLPGPRIVYVNPAFERMTGYSSDEVLGKTPRILQGPRTQLREIARIKKALKGWKSVRAELINYTKSGREFWVELNISPVADEAGFYTHWVSVQREITDRKM
jgi:PAS domain S-box-containing protein